MKSRIEKLAKVGPAPIVEAEIFVKQLQRSLPSAVNMALLPRNADLSAQNQSRDMITDSFRLHVGICPLPADALKRTYQCIVCHPVILKP
jgi:hypothetical protein